MRIAVRFWILLPLLLLLASTLPAEAQTASLVSDLGAEVFAPSSTSSNPSDLLVFRGKVFFIGYEPSSAYGIWVSDGTGAGTELLADLCIDDCQYPEILGSGGNFVFWVAGGSRLWRSDGTRSGTQPLLPDTLVVPSSDNGGSFAFLNGVLYFNGCLRESRCALWRTDGTATGTREVKEVPPESRSQPVAFLKTVAERLFFLSSDSSSFSLWTSDGTDGGTIAVRDLPFFPGEVEAAGSRIFMVLPAPGDREELWTSDGTAVGTVSLASFRPSESFHKIPWLKPIGNRVYFVADDVSLGEEIWRSDGTPEGTQRVTSFGFHDPFRGGLQPSQLEEVGNQVVFYATDGLTRVKLWAVKGAASPAIPIAEVCSDCDFFDLLPLHLARLDRRVLFGGFDPGHGTELWTTDGTPAGTARLTDVCPGPCDSLTDFSPVAAGGTVYAGLRDGRRRFSLWRSDGTPQGTRRIAEPEGGTGGEFVTLGGKVFFAASDDRYGSELWTSDGTPAGSGPVTDIARGVSGSIPRDLTPLFNGIAFLADAPGGPVWASGGTAETTAAVGSAGVGLIEDVVVAGGRIFFDQGDDVSLQVWASNGTPGGLLQLTSFSDDLRFIRSGPLAAHQGRLLFGVANGDILEMWTSDGTPAGTGRAFTLPSTIQRIADLQSLGDQIFLMAEDGEGCHPWLSDGTNAGTRRLTDKDFECFSSKVVETARLGSTLFFTGDLLWRSDGTPAGTFPLRPADFEDGARSLTVFQNALYYIALTPPISSGPGSRRWALWRSDGTVAGTAMVREFERAGLLAAAGGRLFLSADDGVHGTELWTSDGTAAGTVLAQDILPGRKGSAPSAFAVAQGRLYFAANNGVHGTELWVSDGTAAGTRLAQDLAPGAPSSRPERLTLAVDRLFFTADDGLTGRELWVLPLDAAPGTCAPSGTSLCLQDGRFRVEALWRDSAGRFQRGRAEALTADTGYFWFFFPENVEAVLKVLDGRGSNGHFWVFYGALSNVEYALTVTDTQTGLTRRYFNPQGRFASVGDNRAFGPLGAFKRRQPAGPETAPLPLVREGLDAAAATGTCVPATGRLCLNNGRFAVAARWKLPDRNGTGTAVGITGDTGYFWFFQDTNVEAVVKVLDGRERNGRFWVFYGSLSNVEYELTVTDTMTGKTKTYKNPKGRFASAGDTTAF